MTPAPTVFRRPPGSGWLVLAGAFEPSSWRRGATGAGLRERLGHPGPRFCLVPSEVDKGVARERLADLETRLGASVDVGVIEGIPLTRLAGAGAAVLAGGRVEAWLHGFGASVSEEGLLRCLDAGGLIVAAGEAASALGSWVWEEPEGDAKAGLGWVPGAIILTADAQGPMLEAAQAILRQRERLYLLSLPPSGALALGPAAEVEVWGSEAPKVTLGRGWR